MIDIHSHIIPGVDDGAKSFEVAKKMLTELHSCGINKIYATPHYRPGMFETKANIVRKQYKELLTVAKEVSDEIEIFLGQELFYSYSLIDMLDKRKVLTMSKSRCVLVEFDYFADFSYICTAVRNLICASYTPIIAHIERYVNLRSVKHVDKLVDMGVRIQIDITGIIQPKQCSIIKKLLKKELVHFLGSDIHRDGKLEEMSKSLSIISQIVSDNYYNELTWSNPKLILP